MCIVGVPTKPGGPEIPLGVSAGGERSLAFPEEGPDIEVLDSAIPVDEVLGSTLAKANDHQAIPVADMLGVSLEEVVEVTDRDFGEPVKMMPLDLFPRTLSHRTRGGLFVSGHQPVSTRVRNLFG